MSLKVSEIFAGEYLNADDVKDAPITAQIIGVRTDKIGARDTKEKLVLSLHGQEKEFVCNKSNALALAEAIGDDAEGWFGKQITLSYSVTMYEGKRTGCIVASAQKSVPAA